MFLALESYLKSGDIFVVLWFADIFVVTDCVLYLAERIKLCFVLTVFVLYLFSYA